MAIAKSWIILKGSMGETTFEQRGGRVVAKEKINIRRKNRKGEIANVALRTNALRLGGGSHGAKMIRDSLYKISGSCGTTEKYTRMTDEMMKVIKRGVIAKMPEGIPIPRASITQARVEHRLMKGKILMQRDKFMDHLVGFDFNDKVSLRSCFNVRFKTVIDRAAGIATIQIFPFKPATAIKAPKRATHFKLVASASEIDFPNDETLSRSDTQSPVIVLTASAAGPFSMELPFNVLSKGSIFVALGILYSNDVDTSFQDTKQSYKVNAGRIVALNKALEG